MGVENIHSEKTAEQLQLSEYTDRVTLEDFDFVSIERDRILKLPYDLGLRYLRQIFKYGEETVEDGKSFKAKFKIEVPIDENLDFVKLMTKEGCTVISERVPPVCGICGKDIGEGEDGSFSHACSSCGGMTAHMECGSGWFYNHADHDCFPACCDNGHDVQGITEQNFINSTLITETFVEEEYEREPDGSSPGGIVYSFSHFHLSPSDRLAIAHRDFVEFQARL